MHLETIEVEGFRGLPKLSGRFGKGLNVVVGRNNVGKSALLDAIRVCLGQSASQGENIWLTRDDFHVAAGKDPADVPTGPIRVSLQFGDATEDQLSRLLELVEYDAKEPEKSKVRVHFEATWDKTKERALTRRWGGAFNGDRTPVDPEILGDIPVTFLPALRDSNQALQPGNKNRIAKLLERRMRDDAAKRGEIEEIFSKANKSLDENKLITELAESLRKMAEEASGSDFVSFNVRAAQKDYQRILRTLRILLAEGLPELSTTGLGYSNILFMSVVLAHLESDVKEGIAPILLIEEPEAHLHPQLTQLLARYLAGRTKDAPNLQVLATSHSPTFASQVKPSQIVSMSAPRAATSVTCNHLGAVGLDEREEGELQRMMDITKSTLYFAKGFILVEGPSEALLLPELAKRVDPAYDLGTLHVSVIPISGVSFPAFKKILSDKGVNVPVSMVTDADPSTVRGASWETDAPKVAGAAFEVSDRTNKLLTTMAGSATVKVFHSSVTLEYDLAAAAELNAATMADAWASLFDGKPGTFNHDRLAAVKTDAERGLAAWRGICRSSTTMGKAEFAQRLAQNLQDSKVKFEVPQYLRDAITHVAKPIVEAGKVGKPGA